jgi:hypothetical protein
MAKIYDYAAFAGSSKGAKYNDYSFGVELKYIDVDIYDRPEEYADISDAKVFIDYSVDLVVNKSGIEGMNFSVSSVELEFMVDDHPNEDKEFDIDLIPGKTIDFSQLKIDTKENTIPSYPTNVSINMRNSTDPKNFEITVVFGK